MSHRLPALKPAEVIRVLERNGFWRIAKRKKHRTYTDGVRQVTVAYHSKDLPVGTLRSIIRQTGWTEEGFVQRL